jgi:DNA polymerase type B, organellar and viral
MATSRKTRRKPIAALDIETTAGKFQERPTPICVCIKSNDLRFAVKFWGENCIEESVQFLAAQPIKGRLLAHNGGKFDFGYYLHDPGKKRVVGSRLLTSSVTGWETLDTMLLMPTALKNLGHGTESKGEMRLEWHHLDATQEQQEYIMEYCLQDCDVLLNAYSRFCKVFTGDADKPCKDTAASNAFKALKACYPDAAPSQWITTKAFDVANRPYYHGGIVNTFGPARDIVGEFTMVDANSMYPGAMKNYQHPASNRSVPVKNPVLTRDGFLKGFGKLIFFIHFSGYSSILPHVKTTGGLEYDIEGDYWVTSHELQAAIRHGFVRVDKIHAATVWQDTQTYSLFVDDYYARRQVAKADKNPEEYVFKIVLNSAYGKFGQDPSNYSDTIFELPGQVPEDDLEVYTAWTRKGKTSDGSNIIWEREKLIHDTDRAFVNVATAASITGASRACLIDAIGAVLKDGGTVHYCDTDSIVFDGRATMELGAELGQWKIECELDRLIIAGPKLYAFRDAESGKYKVASKGVRATSDQIAALVAGTDDLVHYPEMGSHDVSGVYRTVRRTIKTTSLKR